MSVGMLTSSSAAATAVRRVEGTTGPGITRAIAVSSSKITGTTVGPGPPSRRYDPFAGRTIGALEWSVGSAG